MSNVMLHPVALLGADIFDGLKVGEFENFLLRLIALVVILFAVGNLAKLAVWFYDRFVAHKPPMNDVLSSIHRKLDDMQRSHEQDIKLLMPRTEAKESQKEFETKLENRFTEFSTYHHKRIHDFVKVIDSITESTHQRSERLAAVEANVGTLAGTVSSFDRKLDLLIRESGEHHGRLQK